MTVPHAARDRSAVPGWTQGCTDKARSTSRQRYYHSCLCRVLQVSMFSLKPQYRRWVVYTRTASLLICFKCAASPRGYSRGCAEKLENTNWECSQGWKDRREEWKKMLFQISQYLRWFTYQEYILNIMTSVQGKAQMEYFCIKYSQETTSSFPVSGHIIIKKIMAQNKEGPFLFQVWSTQLDTALYSSALFLWGACYQWTFEAKGSASLWTLYIRTSSPPLGPEIHTAGKDTNHCSIIRSHIRPHWHLSGLCVRAGPPSSDGEMLQGENSPYRHWKFTSTVRNHSSWLH